MNTIDPSAHVPDSAKLGENVTIEAGVLLGSNVIICDNVSLGLGCIIDDNIEIGENSVVGPGAVVDCNVQENLIMQGVPARCVGAVKVTKLEDQTPKKKEIKFAIPPDADFTHCGGCKDPIYWIRTRNNKRMPVNPDGVSHFATCSHAKKFRRVK